MVVLTFLSSWSTSILLLFHFFSDVFSFHATVTLYRLRLLPLVGFDSELRNEDHLFVAIVSSDWAIMGSSGVQCGCRNALSLHCSILLYIVEDSIFSIFLLRPFPPVSFIIFSFDEHRSGLEVLQAKSAALLRTKVCSWVEEFCSPNFHLHFLDHGDYHSWSRPLASQ